MKVSAFLKILLIAVAISNTLAFLPPLISKAIDQVSKVGQTLRNVSADLISNQTTSISGICTYEKVTFKCNVFAGTGPGVEISGGASNILIPYLYITKVSIEKNVLNVSVTYHIDINKGGVKSKLIIVDDWSVIGNNTLTNILAANRAYYLDLVKSLRAKIQKSAEELKVQLEIINKESGVYKSDKEKLAALNSQITDTIKSISKKLSEKKDNTEKLLSKDLAIEKTKALVQAADLAVSSARKENEIIIRLLGSYTKSKTEFSEEKRYEYLNKEQANLCKFHVAAEDLALILPNKALDINKMRAEITKNRNIKSADKTFKSDDFFINKN